MLGEFGINADILNSKLSKEQAFCGPLSQWNDSFDIKDVFIPSSLKLSISMPQIYLLPQSLGYVPPEFWDTGIPALNIGYMANYNNNHYSNNQINDTQTFYIKI